jgi:hypothetical protein
MARVVVAGRSGDGVPVNDVRIFRGQCNSIMPMTGRASLALQPTGPATY